MLNGLIEQNPDALILCTYGFCSTDSRCKTAITDVVSEYSSDNVKTYFYTTVNSTTGHPDVANHRNGAKELENVLKITESSIKNQGELFLWQSNTLP